MEVEVRDTGAAALSPHFTLTTGQGMSAYWTVVRGPGTPPGHATARSAVPQTLSSTDVRLPRSG